MSMSGTIPYRFLAASLPAVFLFGCATADPYAKVAVGESREQVVTLLGSPSAPYGDLTRNEREAIQATLADMQRSDVESFSVWKRPGELFYVVGFDKRGAVAVKREFFYVAP